MATDFQCVFPSSVVPLSSIRILPGVTPISVDVIGQDFRNVDEVTINGIAAKSVVILSPNRLIAQVPDGILDKVTSVVVTSSQLTFTNKSVLRFRLGRSTTKVNGMLRLVQLFVKMLFTTQGTDIWTQRLGGNGLRDVGRSFGRDGGSGIVADFHIAVQETQKQIIAIQTRDPSIPREERLLKAKIATVRYVRTEAALIASIELTNQTGKPVLASMML